MQDNFCVLCRKPLQDRQRAQLGGTMYDVSVAVRAVGSAPEGKPNAGVHLTCLLGELSVKRSSA